MTTPIRTAWLVLTFCLAFIPMPGLADTAADIAKIEGLLRRAEANLNSVQSSLAGREKPPTGSSGKLLAQRLKQAQGDLEPAGKLVQSLAPGEEGVADITERYNKAANLYAELAAFMNGGEAKKEPEPKDGEVKLGYPHADNFKATQFTFKNKVETPANQLVELHAKLKPIEDQLTINHRVTAQALATINEARRQAGFVKDGLAKIPANGQGVAAAKDNLTKALESIQGSEDYFKPLHTGLMAMIDPAKFPDFDDDRKRLRDLSGDYAAEWVFTENRARAAELFQQRKAAQEELVRIARAYQRLMQQQTEMGVAIEAVGNGTLRSFEEFDARIAEQKKTLPKSIREDLAEAQKYGDEAVANQKPMWFAGGIPQRMGRAEDKLALLKAIDKENGPAVAKEVAATQAKLNKQADALKALIIKENRIPADNFAGPDRIAAIKVAKSGWAVQQKDAKILKVVIPAESWARETKWTYSNGAWYFSDRSKLQVRLIVADHKNLKQAIDRPVTVIKDHQKGDTMIGVPFRSFDEALQPSEYYLAANVK
ncbi:MAG: hypothetical protein AAF711_09650 [Planctomycetota bacterium]